MRKYFYYLMNSHFSYRPIFIAVFFLFIATSIKLEAQVSTLQDWTNVYHGTATTAQNSTYTIPTGSNANRVLVVAIASARTTTGTRTVSLTYGGQTLNLETGDMGTTSYQHTALYYLNEAGLDAAVGTTLSVTVSSGTTRMTDVFAAVFDNVYQTNPITDSQNYNNTSTATTFAYATALNISAYNLGLEIVSSDRVGNTTLRTVNTYPTNWTLTTEQTSTSTDAIRHMIIERSIPTSSTTDNASITMSGSSYPSMTALSLNGIPPPAAEPTTQASVVTFSSVTTTGMTIGWTSGNGSNSIVLVKSGSAVDSNPVDGTSYTANTAFTSGTQIGTGNYVVYNGTGTSVAITGLSSSTTYHVAVYEFNGSGGSENYLTTSPATGNQITNSPPTYTWAGANNASWATAANWTPTRTTPAATDVLQFNTGTTLTITAVPTQAIGRFVMSASTNITLQSTSAQTLTIGNGTGTDLDIPLGSSLTLGTNTSATLASSATASIAGTLTINSGSTYNTDGTSVVTTVTGSLVNKGTFTNATAGKLLLQNGSTFQHDVNNFTWPTATWDPGAIFNVTGLGTNSQSNPYPAFPTGVKNLIWDCPAQNFSNAIAQSGALSLTNLTIKNTGSNATTGQFRVQSTSGTPITVANDLTITGGIMWVAALGYDKSLDVGGDATLSGGKLDVVGAGGTYNGTVNITGNLSLSGSAILDLSDGASTTGDGTVNLKGNYTQSGTSSVTVSSTSTGNGTFNFNGTSAQTFSKTGGTISCVTSGNTLTFNIPNNAIVDFGTSVLDDNGSSGTRVLFTLASGGGIITGNTNGISSTGATGSIQVAGTRTYNAAGDYTYNGSSAQVTGLGLPATLNGTLTINNAAGVTLSRATEMATASGILALTNGNLNTTSTNILVIGPTGSFTGGSATSFVSGPLTHAYMTTGAKTMDFPIGKGGIYRPVSFYISNETTTDVTEYKAEMFNSPPPSNTLASGWERVSAVRYYTLSKSGSSGFSGGVITLQYGSDDGVTTPANLDVALGPIAGGGTWTNLAGNGSGSPTGSISNTTTFSLLSNTCFTIASTGTNPLPIELSSFTGSASGGNVTLNWATATEISNFGFEVLRDGEKVGFVKGARNSNSPKEYSFTDQPIGAKTFSYQLKQVDMDGQYKMYGPVEVTLETPLNFSLHQNYPNPYNPTTKIKYEVPFKDQVTLKVFNSLGQEVATLFDGIREAGTYEVIFNGSNLSSGVYFYSLTTSTYSKNIKMILMR